jgi:hypothetical protein
LYSWHISRILNRSRLSIFLAVHDFTEEFCDSWWLYVLLRTSQRLSRFKSQSGTSQCTNIIEKIFEDIWISHVARICSSSGSWTYIVVFLAKACFIRRILIASNAIKTIDNEMIKLINRHYLIVWIALDATEIRLIKQAYNYKYSWQTSKGHIYPFFSLFMILPKNFATVGDYVLLCTFESRFKSQPDTESQCTNVPEKIFEDNHQVTWYVSVHGSRSLLSLEPILCQICLANYM